MISHLVAHAAADFLDRLISILTPAPHTGCAPTPPGVEIATLQEKAAILRGFSAETPQDAIKEFLEKVSEFVEDIEPPDMTAKAAGEKGAKAEAKPATVRPREHS